MVAGRLPPYIGIDPSLISLMAQNQSKLWPSTPRKLLDIVHGPSFMIAQNGPRRLSDADVMVNPDTRTPRGNDAKVTLSRMAHIPKTW